ncbi:MAG: hotdog fold thioesterase [Bacteroidaceae bacterium]|nr:hotdog fold thioesterase [Bacteroidaceae bacterium]
MTLLNRLNQSDIFARQNGIQLTEVREGYAKAEMTVGPNHINGANVCQGGAIFTLADLAFAAVCNSHGILTLGISNTIDYLTSAHLGDHLVAEATEVVNHPKMPQCVMRVTNQDGVLIATATGRAYRKRIPFEADSLM